MIPYLSGSPFADIISLNALINSMELFLIYCKANPSEVPSNAVWKTLKARVGAGAPNQQPSVHSLRPVLQLGFLDEQPILPGSVPFI